MVLGGFQVGCKSNISKPTFMHAKFLVFDTLGEIEKTISQRPIQLDKEKKTEKGRTNQCSRQVMCKVTIVPSSLIESVCF
jgi:hypothetical protein